MDTVKVAFEVDLSQCDTSSSLWLGSSSRNPRTPQSATGETFRGRYQGTSANAAVRLYTERGICHLEFNAARMAGLKAPDLLPPDALSVLVGKVIEEVSTVVWPVFQNVDEVTGQVCWAPHWEDQVKLRRLDLARDFIIDQPALVQRVLKEVQPKYGKTKAEYRGPHGSWTLTNQTKSTGMERIYDKSAELASDTVQAVMTKAGDRRFRFETEIRRDRLNALGLRRLSDVSAHTAWQALEHRWNATRWGSPLPSSTDLSNILMGMTPQNREKIVGFLHLEACGLTSDFSESQLNDRRARVRKAGLLPGIPVDLQGPPSHFLDLSSGRLIRIPTP
ncbi:MAG: hypothetical protein R2737_07440 [Candidatus Nanopelagicales bacterium]